MVEYFWGHYGFPTEDCVVEDLTRVIAYAWNGEFDSLTMERYEFMVAKPDPRSSAHTVIGLHRITHPGTAGVEIHIHLDGPYKPNAWEQFRVLGYDTREELETAFASEMPWAGTPNFK
jgi:hypothetical protein